MEEELLGTYPAKVVSNIKSVLTGFKSRFLVKDFESRVNYLASIDSSLGDGLNTRAKIVDVLTVLYRIGALGNHFATSGKRGYEGRDRWVFRDMPEPAVAGEFVVHESLRKVLQLSFSE